MIQKDIAPLSHRGALVFFHSHWVKVNVAGQCREILAILNQMRFVSPLKKMTALPVATIQRHSERR